MVQEKRVNYLVVTRNSCTFALVNGRVTNKAVTNGGLCDRNTYFTLTLQIYDFFRIPPNF